MSSRITMADVARRAGVHVTTVSLALRNHPNLPSQTRQRLQALAREMGYQPDPSLRALSSYRRNRRGERNALVLGYVTNWNSEWGWKTAPAHYEFFLGAEAKAQELGFQLQHYWIGDPRYAEADLSELLWKQGIHGVILASHRREVDVPPKLDWSRFSAVKIDYFPHGATLHTVSNDQRAIIGLAMDRVFAAGYRRVGFVMHRGWDHSVDHWWSAGYYRAQQKLAPRDRIPICLFPELEPVSGWMTESTEKTSSRRGMFEVPPEIFETWYQRYRPDVIVSKKSFVDRVMQAIGLRVPRDVGYVDLFLDHPDGKTAGVRQNHLAVGAAAVQIVAGQFQQRQFGPPAVPLITGVEGTWFDGQSLPARVSAEAAPICDV